MITQIAINLFLVLCSIVIFFYGAAKLRHKKSGAGVSIELLASLSIGTKEKIILVNAAGARLLLGITPTSITTLKTYDYVEPDSDNKSIFSLADAKVIEK